MSISVHVDMDVSGAVQTVAALGEGFSSRAYMKLLGLRLLYWINQNFTKGGEEQPWTPLSPNTVAARRGGGAGAQPLRDTGRLAQSFVSEISSDQVWIGTRDQRAPWHHYGTAARSLTTNPPGRLARQQETIKTGPRKGQPTKRRGALFFITAGGKVFRHAVRHPGIPARPLLPTKALAERLGLETLQGYVDELTRRVEGQA